MFSEIGEAVAPMVIEAVAALVILFWGWVAVWARRKFGVDVEMVNREALHRALTTGAELLIDDDMAWESKIGHVVHYAKQSVPDAIGYLVKDESILRKIAEAKLKAMLANRLPLVARHEAERTIQP